MWTTRPDLPVGHIDLGEFVIKCITKDVKESAFTVGARLGNLHVWLLRCVSFFNCMTGVIFIAFQFFIPCRMAP